MSSNNGFRKRKAEELIEALETLTSEDAQDYYASMRPMILKPEQYQRLGAIYDQLRPSGEKSTATPVSNSVETLSSVSLISHIGDYTPTGDDSPTAQDPSSKPNKRGRPSKNFKEGPKTNECWKGVKDLVHLSLEPELSELIKDSKEKPGGELAAFFFHRCSSQRSPPVRKDGNDTVVLASLCINLAKRNTSTVIDDVSWLFEALAVGDIFLAIFGMDCITRISSKVKRTVIDAVAEGDRTGNFPKDLMDGMVFACNVYIICDVLRTGSLFFLRPNLTRNFLKNLVTKNGDIFDEMLTNFRKRGFPEEIEQSGANKVGDAVRAHFRAYYKLNKAEPGSDPTTATALTSTHG